MSDGSSKLETKLDKLDERLDRIELILERNTQSLADHIRRTEILETEMKPVKDHVAMVGAWAKLVAGGAAALTFVLGTLKSLGLL